MDLDPITLPYRPPYDWEGLLGFLAARAIPGVEVVEGGAYHRSITIDGAAGVISVGHEPDSNGLLARVRFPTAGSVPSIIARLRRLFDLDAEPEAIGAALGRDETLAPLVARRPGLRVPGAWDGFELMVRAILGQQITVAAATRLAGVLTDRLGAPLGDHGGDPRITCLFPTPAALAAAEIAGMPAARARAIKGIARIIEADPRLLERAGDLAESVRRLRAAPGIGEWTAQYIAMRALREPDAFPAADIGLMRALDHGAGRPSPAELLARAEAWRPWRAYAALHLWTHAAAPRISRPGVETATATP